MRLRENSNNGTSVVGENSNNGGRTWNTNNGTNMSEFKWEAGFSKIKSIWSTTNDAKVALKTKWQNAFKTNASVLWDVVNQNILLKTDLGLTGSNNNAAGLNSLINDTSSKLYNFVTVQ